MKNWHFEFIDYIGSQPDDFDAVPIRKEIYSAATPWAALREFRKEYPLYEVESIRLLD